MKKTCNDCAKKKDISEFRKFKRKQSDGTKREYIRGDCAVCENTKARARLKELYKNPKFRAHIRKYARKYYQENKEKIYIKQKEYSQKWQPKNRDKLKMYMAKYRATPKYERTRKRYYLNVVKKKKYDNI